MNNSQKLFSLGQSIWYDNIQRRLIKNGSLRNLIENGEIYGVTSNPSIFYQSISKSSDYDDAISTMAIAGCSSEDIYNQLTKADILCATDEFSEIYKKTNKRDGYVSIEVNPVYANDAQKMIDEARAIWADYGRPNIMIKVPATLAGVDTFQQLIRDGINVNVTLIFTISRYQKVIDAYFKGLEQRVEDGHQIGSVASVASFFISRVDTKVDKIIQEIIERDSVKQNSLAGLSGKAAIANAKVAYEIFTEAFSSNRFGKLKKLGAMAQRPLWASTGTKNPDYNDVLYVDELIGADTVNTIPPATLDYFLDHGKNENSITKSVSDAHVVIDTLQGNGISLEKIGMELENEGLKIFSEAYTDLLNVIEKKRKDMQNLLGELQQEVKIRVEVLGANNVIERILAHDATLWSDKPKDISEIEQRLGWLELPKSSRKLIDEILSFRDEVISSGYKTVFLLGMGGSSLAPEVFKLIFGSSTGIELVIVDSTNPAHILNLQKDRQLRESLFIVSSKSGGTSEVNAFLDYFWNRCKIDCGTNIGSHFIAITDPGTSLEQVALSRNFRKIFLADPNVGGRYSALTAFGLVPAGLLGIDLDEVLNQAINMSELCRISTPACSNPGLVLGAIMGQAAISGRDKLNLITDDELRPFSNWLEQLIAESSGKDGVGILPVIEENFLPMRFLGNDRVNVYLRLKGKYDKYIQKLIRAKKPVIIIPISSIDNVFAELYRWEFATAIACSILRVNAFDQPDVQDNKNRTVHKINDFIENGRFIDPPLVWEDEWVKIYSSDLNRFNEQISIKEIFNSFIASGQKGDYVAINAYLPYVSRNISALKNLRKHIQMMSGFITTRGFGPRFLHSTGQLHKGGSSNALFIQITQNPKRDIKYKDLSFGTLEKAQALGDYESLLARGRKILRIHLKKGTLSQLLKQIK